MKQRILLLTFFILLYKISQASIMGMSYSIQPDSNYKGLDIKNVSTEEYLENLKKTKFPSGLNWFFERSGAFGDVSEFYQVQKILNIDMSIFDASKFPYNEETYEPEDNWIKIDSMLSKIDEIISGINTNPEYYQSLIYEKKYKNQSEYDSLIKPKSDSLFNQLAQAEINGASTQEKEALIKQLNIDEIGIEYPLKTDYLDNGTFVDDLLELKSKLQYLKRENVILINFQYY